MADAAMRSSADVCGDGSSLQLRRPLLGRSAEEARAKSGGGSDCVAARTIPWLLRLLLWTVLLVWIALMFAYPVPSAHELLETFEDYASHSFMGRSGGFLLLYALPPVIIAFLGAFYLQMFASKTRFKFKSVKLRLWTFPAFTDGLFGVASAAEVIVIAIFAIYIAGAMAIYIYSDNKRFGHIYFPGFNTKYLILKLIGLRLGIVGQFCLGFLFLPIARGSMILRLMDIPYEHAAKYHVWLGHVTMALFTGHGFLFMIGWSLEGRLMEEVTSWSSIGIANFPGVISLCAGLAMWVTSLQYVRRRFFELFFYTHQLYIVFVVFLALHVGDFIFCIAAAGIFFFFMDRFLRFCQSRSKVDLIGARCLPCGTVELVISKPSGLCYNALSFIFIQIKNLSWLQWHPFSVSSSPYDAEHHLSILIKPLGKWTDDLRDLVLENMKQSQEPHQAHCLKKLKLSVEGPYGHEAPFYLSYKILILVAGGIGISPFVALVRDLLHRLKRGEPGLPETVLLVWAVKKSKELSIFNLVDETTICPNYPEKINLQVQVYVTQESEPDLENWVKVVPLPSSPNPNMTHKPISCLVGTGNIMWAVIYLASSVLGFILAMALCKMFFLDPYKVVYWWLKGLCLLLCMVVGIVICGGASIFLWNMWGCKFLRNWQNIEDSSELVKDTQHDQQKVISEETKKLLHAGNINYGCRPNLKEIFEKASDKWENVNVGVMVCGPPSLASNVAKECRAYNFNNSRNGVVLHFNLHSFDL